MIRPFSAIQVSFSRALKAPLYALAFKVFPLASDITKALFDFILFLDWCRRRCIKSAAANNEDGF